MSLVSDPGPAVIVIEGGDDGTGSIVVISEQGPPGPAGSPGIGGSALDDLLAQLEAEIAQREADKAELDAMDAALDGQAQAINTTLQGHIDSVTGAVVAEETRATAREDAIEAAYEAADELLQARAEKNQANGYAGLNGAGLLDQAKIDAAIARDAEVTLAIAAEAAARDAAITAAVSALETQLTTGAPGLLDTLDERAAALGDDPNFAATVTAALAGKQALNGNLTALAGLNLVADRMVYANGAGTLGLAALTAVARTFMAATTVADQRAALALGSAALAAAADFDPAGSATAAQAAAIAASQPLATMLTNLVAVAGAGANKLPYLTGANAWATATLDAWARANVLSATSAADLRTAAGLGTMAVEAAATYATVASLNTEIANRQAGDSQYDAINDKANNWTFGAGDLRCFAKTSKATAITGTIPLDSTYNYPVGTRLDGRQGAAGQLTLVGEAGVTVTSIGATATQPKTRTNGSGFQAIKEAANTWWVGGDVV